jgi:hypothetical protein
MYLLKHIGFEERYSYVIREILLTILGRGLLVAEEVLFPTGKVLLLVVPFPPAISHVLTSRKSFVMLSPSVPIQFPLLHVAAAL